MRKWADEISALFLITVKINLLLVDPLEIN